MTYILGVVLAALCAMVPIDWEPLSRCLLTVAISPVWIWVLKILLYERSYRDERSTQGQGR